MRFVRWLQLIVLMILLAACSPKSGTGITSLFGPSPTLPAPAFGVTAAPSAETTMRAFLEALKKDDFAGMYALLSKSTQDALPQEEFARKYNDALNAMGAAKLDYELLSETKSPDAAQVGFRITYHTSLVGDLQRDMNAKLGLEQGQWRIHWDDSLILPELAGGNVLKMDYQIPSRGDIYDAKGLPIVTQSDAYAIGMTGGTLNPKSSGVLSAELALLCHKSQQSIQDAYDAAGAGWYVPVCDASVEETNGVLDMGAAGLTVTPYSSRFYLEQGIAPQAVGYASLIHKEDLNKYLRLGYRGDEKVEQTGIEKSMEQYLAGKHGGTLYVVGGDGQIVNTLAKSDPQPADSVYLTIDRNLQLEVQKTLMSFTGAAVVIERDTGRVLAMASSPEYDQNLFDPNNFNGGYLLGDVVNDPNQPLVNRAAQGQYPLGSAFKPITMAAALESGLYLPQTMYDCQYDFTELQQVGGPVLHDWTWEHCQDRLASGRQCDTGDSQPSGPLTLQEGLMRSCDPYFWHIGLDLYNNNRSGDIPAMAKAFGLGSATGIGTIAEATGNVPDPKEPIDATNLAIGQGDLQVTPLQVARFVAALGNGGTLYRPQLIEKIQPVNGDPLQTFKPEAQSTLPITKERLLAIQQAMQMVVKSPRGTAYYRLLGLDVNYAGKTGTAQTGPGLKPDAWFIGYTNAAGDTGKPDIAIAVLLENQGEGSDWAAPVFRGIVQAYYYGNTTTIPWFGPFEDPFTPTAIGAAPGPTRTPRPSGKPTRTPKP
ncbi:MAG: penicillin-binding transpeptidase domain-containing protein [Anaerolineae bacterium]